MSSKSATKKNTIKGDIILNNFTEERAKDIEEKYNLLGDKPAPNLVKHVQMSTKISDVINGNLEISHPFLDEARREKRVVPTMISRFSNGYLPNDTTVHCFWCKHGFETPPIGCPIRFVSSQLCKRYTSEITKDPYTIKENLTTPKKTCMVDMEKPEGISITLIDKDYYETDGIFCSFNCALSWIDDMKHSPIYTQSRQLLYKMYNDTYGRFPTDIIKAPHWRLLRSYGGPMDIEEFRKGFNSIQYNLYNIITTRPKMHTIGFLFEEKPKF
jgi:hypothetical protein